MRVAGLMRVSIDRLRVGLLVGAGLLVIVIAAFLGYAHMRAHRFLKDLPGRLGADITRESNGYTYSQSSKGRTIYTIHAAKLVQRKDGKTTLRDVGIVLYGQRQDRADRIYGSEFEYDQRAGVVRAMGEVHLDLQAPAPVDARGRAEYAAGRDPASSHTEDGAGLDGPDERMVHVKTSGLVFVQSLGVASTDQEIEFQYHGLNGRARGADFNSDTGVTVLQSEVRVSGLRDGQPVVLTAAHAEMDRGKAQMTLDRARYVSLGDGKALRADERTLVAEQAVVHLRSDGSVERVVASGGVSLEQAGGALKGRDADVSVSPQSRPETARVWGGVTYVADERLRQVQGRAAQGTARFSAEGRIDSAVLTDAAEVHERQRSSEAAAWNDRTISGDRVEMHFATAAGGRQWVRDGAATGAARLLTVTRSLKDTRAGEATSELRGDTLTAQMVWEGGAERLSRVNGVGHTLLRRTDASGAEETSQGQRLEVSFATASLGQQGHEGHDEGGRGANGGLRATAESQVTRAVQRGEVVLTHLPAKRAGRSDPPSLVRATAGQAVFEAAGQTLTLTEQAQVTEGDSLMRAEMVRMRRDTGDAVAEGSVKASYRQAGSTEPVHVLAARAELKHDAGVATFFGTDGSPARLWQGGSQVEAPRIEFSQAEKTLIASASGAAGQVVQTVLAGSANQAGGRKGSQVMRVSSRGLRYAESERRAQFSGGVVFQSADGTVRSSQMVALLRPNATADRTGRAGATGEGAAGSAGVTRSAFLGGAVDRVTAEGAVEVTEQGRHGSGERLVYTASDGLFVMTGTAAAPPRVVDEAQGTVSGAALEFHAGDNSVTVLGDAKDGEGRKVRTETQVRQR